MLEFVRACVCVYRGPTLSLCTVNMWVVWWGKVCGGPPESFHRALSDPASVLFTLVTNIQISHLAFNATFLCAVSVCMLSLYE